MSKTKNNKNNKNKDKTKKQNAKPKPALVSSVRIEPIPSRPTKPPMELVERICAVTDPFCQVAKGSKWPDGMGQSTMSAQIRGHRTYGTYSNGGNIIYITPCVKYTSMYVASVSGSVYTTAAGYDLLPGNDFVSAYANTYRVVTAGVIVRNVAPALTAQGYLIITRAGSGAFPGLSTTVASGNVYGTETATHPLVAGLEIPLIFRPVGSSSRAFRSLSTGSTVLPDGGFDVLTIEIVGAAAGIQAIDLEFVYNVEFTLTQTNEGLNQFLPVTAPSNPIVTSVANKASLALGDLAYEGVKAFGNMAIRKITSSLVAAPDPRVKMLGYGAAMLVD